MIVAEILSTRIALKRARRPRPDTMSCTSRRCRMADISQHSSSRNYGWTIFARFSLLCRRDEGMIQKNPAHGASMRTRAWLDGVVAGVFLLMCAEAPAAGAVTFNKDVLPILQRNCQTCHRPGNIAPMSFLTYETTRPWAKAMKAAVLTRKMPPWFADPQYGHFSNDRSLKQADIDTIVQWVDNGALQGDP